MKKLVLFVSLVIIVLISIGCTELLNQVPKSEYSNIIDAHEQIAQDDDLSDYQKKYNSDYYVPVDNPTTKLHRQSAIGFYPTEESEYYGTDLSLFFKKAYYSGGEYVSDWYLDYEGEIVASYEGIKVGENMKTVAYPHLGESMEILEIGMTDYYGDGTEVDYALVSRE